MRAGATARRSRPPTCASPGRPDGIPKPGSAGAEFYRSAYELIVEDARTVTLRFDKVTFDFASLGDFQPLPAHVERARWEQEPRTYRSRTAYDTETANPALWSGPYRITAVQPGAGVTLERNPAWQGAGAGFPPPAVRTIENTAALEAQLLAGQLDMVAGELGLPVEQAAALERRTAGRFQVVYKPGLIYEHLDLRLDNPILADVRVRQALLLAIDRAQIVARLFEGRQTVAHGSVNPLDPMHDRRRAAMGFDPARAARAAGSRRLDPRPDGIRRNAAGERLSDRADDHRRQPGAGGGAAGPAGHVAPGRDRGADQERAAARLLRRDPVKRKFQGAGAVRLDQRAGRRTAQQPAFGRDPDRGEQLVRPELSGLPQPGDGRAAGGDPAGARPRQAARAVVPAAGDLSRRTCRPCRSGSGRMRMSGRNGWRMCGRPGT